MKHELSFCEIEQLTDSIFEITVNEGAEIDEKCIEEEQIFWHNLRNEPFRLLVNNKHPHSFSFEGASKIGEHPLQEKTAVLVNNHSSTVQASMVMDIKELYGSVVRIRTFQDRDKAIKWLETPG